MDHQHTTPLTVKRMWSLVGVMLLLLRKGILKDKLITELRLIIQRWKTARKSMGNLLFHHHQNNKNSTDSMAAPTTAAATTLSSAAAAAAAAVISSDDYEFSCSSSPMWSSNGRRRSHRRRNFFLCAQPPATAEEGSGHGEGVIAAATESPFEGGEVDKAAEEFIERFYRELMHQRSMEFI